MKLSDDFYNSVPRFCEYYFWDKKEYLNTITSLAISFFGVYGLLLKSPFIVINILYALLVSNGIASALNHWYGNKGWRYVDSLIMLISVIIGIVLIICLYLQFHTLTILPVYKLITYLFISVLIYLPIVLHKYTSVFDYLFLFLSLSLLLFIPVVNSIKPFVTIDICNVLNLAIIKFIKGALWVGLGAILWFITEPKCFCTTVSDETKSHLGGMFFHILWHFFAGFGFYLMINSFNMVQSVI